MTRTKLSRFLRCGVLLMVCCTSSYADSLLASELLTSEDSAELKPVDPTITDYFNRRSQATAFKQLRKEFDQQVRAMEQQVETLERFKPSFFPATPGHSK